MNKFFAPAAIGAVVVLLALTQVFFVVDQREQAIVLQFGQPVGDIKGPGLHFKIPVIQGVVRFDRRVLSVDPGPEQMVISSATHGQRPQAKTMQADTTEDVPSIEHVSGEPIIVDTFARYRITDALQFMKTLRTIPAANTRLEGILKDATRASLGNTTLPDLLSEKRAGVMRNILDRVNSKVKQDKLGIEIIDVRIVRADLTADLRTSTVRRMISELTERATETRAKGEEQALAIRSTAEKERTVLIAEARRDSEIVKGQGDKDAIRIYAEAFNKDTSFYAFIRSMEAYKNTLADPETKLILSPDSEFFRYFQKNAAQ